MYAISLPIAVEWEVSYDNVVSWFQCPDSRAYKQFDGYSEEWADFIYQHRDETIIPPYMHPFDVVYGPIANDRVGLQIRNYRLGNIDKKEFLRRLKYMKGVTFQYAFCTQCAIEKLQPYECK